MEAFSSWESLLLGVMKPGIKASLEQSKNAESDWGSLLLPLGFVVLFVIFLVAMV